MLKRIAAKKLFPEIEYLVFFMAAALRFFRLDAQSLWSDEGNSVALAQTTFADIAARTALDIHPPFYYWLLKVWTSIFGLSEFAVRSLSAVLGFLLVLVVYQIGSRFFSRRVGLAAAIFSAFSPFQIYYAQEARMYMLLALLGALLVLISAEMWRRESWSASWIASYIVVAVLGLYTQYAFPVMLLVVNIASFVFLWRKKSHLWRWLLLQIVPLLLYAPWLPIAYRQLTGWDKSLLSQSGAGEIARTLLQYLAFGISGLAINAVWLWFFGIALLSAFVWAWRNETRTHLLIWLWLIFPVALTAYLFRPAYLKFLLVASPAFSLILGIGVSHFTPTRKTWQNIFLSLSLSTLIAVASLLSLRATYFNAEFQRDNYRGIAATIKALATADDAVILYAPGQQEVFGYYFDDNSVNVYPEPRQRPIDEPATLSEMSSIAAEHRNLYGVFWATEEADPNGVIENWLNENTFKANDIWFGNVRLVSFATANTDMPAYPIVARFGKQIQLSAYQLPDTTLRPGEILQVGLQWKTDSALRENYTVFLQLLDNANHLVAQRDASPKTSTPDWQVGDTVADKHGLWVQPGTPPGRYRLVVGLYNSATGERLTLENGESALELATVSIEKNQSPLPIDAFAIQNRLDAPPLVGYDLYKLGHASEPNSPIHIGDAIHLNLYWQKPTVPLAEDSLFSIVLHSGAGDYARTIWQGEPISGYPMSAWNTGEIMRGQLDFFLNDIDSGPFWLEFFAGDVRLEKSKAIYTVP